MNPLPKGITFPCLAISMVICFLSFSTYSCGEVPTEIPGQPVEHFVGDFETGNFNNFHFLVPDTSFNTQIVTHPVRKGTFALKNTLRPKDYIFNGIRSELSVYNCAKYKTEVYYGFSVLIDTNYDDLRYNLICQWQDLPYYITGEVWEPTPVLHGSPPPLALIYVDGNFELKRGKGPVSQETELLASAPAITKGVWHDLVFHVFWSDEDDGYIEAWFDGNYFTPNNGADFKVYKPNLYVRSGNYFKFGQYRGKETPTQTNTVYFDEIKIGTSYTEVAP
jgi:hypothetical protein